MDKLICLVVLALGFLKKTDLKKIEERKRKACEILINIEEPLFDKHQRNIENVTKLVDVHVKGLNAIFESTFFSHHYSHFYFRVKNIIILSAFNFNKTTRHFGYLKQFTKYNSTGVCLSIIFTLRDFPQGIQGLAWRNTVCENSFNTGFITFLNHGRYTPVEDSIMTFAHEVAHSFGARHNEATTCGNIDKGQGFIMSESGTNSRHPRFTTCSLHDMNIRMDKILKATGPEKHLNCFVDRLKDNIPPSFCGNEVVEDGEECDCGMEYQTCGDSCCYAGRLSPEDTFLGDRIRMRKVDGVQPHPCHRHSLDRCVRPWMSAVSFGIILPLVFVSFMSVLMAAVLRYDWRREKVLYSHVTQPTQLIRTETALQAGRRAAREAKRNNGSLLVEQGMSPPMSSLSNCLTSPPINNPPPPPTHRLPPPPPPPLSDCSLHPLTTQPPYSPSHHPSIKNNT